MRYFADTIYSIWEDIKGLFGPSKAFYTFLGIGLAIWLISATNQATVLSEIGKAIFLFCLIKLAIERAPKRDQENEIVKTLKDIGITDVKSSRASLTLEDVEFLTKAKKRLWIAGFLIDDLINNEIDSAKSTRPAKQQIHLLRDLLQLAAKPNFDFKLLMLDPLNRGAYLHQTLDTNFVNQCQRKINDIEAFLRANKTKQGTIINRECIKLCRTYPMISLAIADDTAIFQPWFFKPDASERRTRIGVFRCEEKPIISCLESHFLSIWDKQSVSLDDFQKNHARGTDCAVQYLDIANMYLARHPDIDGTPRMLAILKNTKEYLYVKQVSLRHLLTNLDLIKEFVEVLKRSVTVRLLFIDVDSEVAMMRSYGEYIQGCELTGQQPEVKTYKEFRIFKDNQGDLLRHNQPLCRDTRDAIKIANILKNTYPNLSINTYYAAPDAAIIVNEHSALFESLHYGAKRPRKTANYMTILSGEMPLMEFKKDEGAGGQVYDVVKSNFNFVWEHLSQDVKNAGGIS